MRKTIIFLAILLALFTAACTAPQEPDAQAFAPVESGSPGGLYPVSDLSVIGATGRHQFINIYANW